MSDHIEPTQIGDVYADGIAEVEILGCNVRLIFFTWERGQKVVVAKIIRPMASILDMRVREMIATAQSMKALYGVARYH